MAKNEPEFWPKDTDTEMYIAGDCNLADIIARVNEKWPGVDLADIDIAGEEIHTHCLGYDLYDPADWTRFVVITRS